jgi:tRNA(Ile)-lysidine synthase
VRKKRLDPYAAAVLDTLRRRRLVVPGDHVLVALSAGPDSTALLAALAELRDSAAVGELRLSALHVDHGLRADSGADAAAAAATCARLAVPFASEKVQVARGNVQAEARRARYAALRREAARVGATRIATGHTRTDQAETVLLRLFRGAGARGLAGIPPRRGRIVRPLIDRARSEGLAYLAARGVPFRDDPTNATPRYARNRLRLSVWPAIAALAPSAERALARTADLARDDERALARSARILAAGEPRISIEVVRAAPVAVRRRLVQRLFRTAAGRRVTLERKHVEAVLALIGRRGPGTATLPGGLEARCRYGTLELGPVFVVTPASVPVDVPGPGRYLVGPDGLSIELSARRPEQVPWPALLRRRRPGDRFRPEHGRGGKKLKAWLIDEKVPREQRNELIVLASGARVLAIPALGVVEAGLGASGAGLVARLEPARSAPRSPCKRGGGLL